MLRTHWQARRIGTSTNHRQDGRLSGLSSQGHAAAPAAQLGASKAPDTTANALGDASVLLVQAPAGFGKTSLLAQWRKEIQSTGVAVAWLSAHTRDDPHRLVQALTLAVRVASGKAAFGQAAFEFDSDDRLEHVTVFLAELAQSAQELVLIVDEADKLPEASREALNYLLR